MVRRPASSPEAPERSAAHNPLPGGGAHPGGIDPDHDPQCLAGPDRRPGDDPDRRTIQPRFDRHRCSGGSAGLVARDALNEDVFKAAHDTEDDVVQLDFNADLDERSVHGRPPTVVGGGATVAPREPVEDRDGRFHGVLAGSLENAGVTS